MIIVYLICDRPMHSRRHGIVRFALKRRRNPGEVVEASGRRIILRSGSWTWYRYSDLFCPSLVLKKKTSR